MVMSDYRRLVEEARLQARQARDPLSAATVVVEAARRIPRFPSFLPMHVELLWPVFWQGLEDIAIGLWANVGVLLTRVLLLAGASEEAEEVVEKLEEVAAGRGIHRVKACASLARGLVLAAQQRLPGAEAELSEAEKALVDDPDNAVWIRVAWTAVLLAGGERAKAEQEIEKVLDLTKAEPLWGGERFDALQKRAFICMSNDRLDEAARALEEAYGLAREHGAVRDAWFCVASLTPLLVGMRRAERAVELLENAIGEVQGADDVPQGLELALRKLKMTALDSAGKMAEAIEEGFEAIRRCAEIGTTEDFGAFVVEVAGLYQRGGAPLDAYNVLAVARKGLRMRGAKEVEVVQEALDALREDLGPEEYYRIAAEAARLNPMLQGEEG